MKIKRRKAEEKVLRAALLMQLTGTAVLVPTFFFSIPLLLVLCLPLGTFLIAGGTLAWAVIVLKEIL